MLWNNYVEYTSNCRSGAFGWKLCGRETGQGHLPCRAARERLNMLLALHFCFDKHLKLYYFLIVIARLKNEQIVFGFWASESL